MLAAFTYKDTEELSVHTVYQEDDYSVDHDARIYLGDLNGYDTHAADLSELLTLWEASISITGEVITPVTEAL